MNAPLRVAISRKSSLTHGIRRHAVSGFTVMEVVAVLAILGILTAVTITRMPQSHADLASETSAIKAHLAYVQNRAMCDELATWGVRFDADAYVLLRDGAAAPVAWPNESGSTRRLPANVRVTSGTGNLTFDRWGSPGTRDVVLALNGQDAVRVTANTGFIP